MLTVALLLLVAALPLPEPGTLGPGSSPGIGPTRGCGWLPRPDRALGPETAP